jgi:hypothetical protein
MSSDSHFWRPPYLSGMPKPAFRPCIPTRGTKTTLPTQGKVNLMAGERIVFTEESNLQNYLKLVASGEVDETMLEALEDYVKRQKKRLSARPTIDSPKARAEMRAFMKEMMTKRPPIEAAFHINTITSPIPTKVYKPATVTPRQTSAMTLSDPMICLLLTGTPDAICPSPITSRGKVGFVPGQTYKSVLWNKFTEPAPFQGSADGEGRL